MFDNPKKELERLQEQLLKDEEWFEKELDSAKRMIGQQPTSKRSASKPTGAPQKTAPVRNYANGHGGSASQSKHRKPVTKQKEAPRPKAKSNRGLLTLAAIEILGIAGLAAYWVLVLLK